MQKNLWALAGLLLTLVASQASAEEPEKAIYESAGSGGINAADQRNKPYLILISIDGFRWDYFDLYETPAMDEIIANGLRAEAMVPVFPTLTFPNHYSIATGLYPANHGLIGNRFPGKDRSRFYTLYDRKSVQDGRWYGGEPVWVTAEKNGLVTAAYYFVGTEAAVGGVPLTYWHDFDATVPGHDRVAKVLEWLAMEEARRPHLITLYFEDVDEASHRFGPGSAESIESIRRVDDYIAQLMNGVAALAIAERVYVVIVSDHGQSLVKKDAPPFIITSVASLDDLTVVDHGAASFIYFPEPDPQRATKIRDSINASWRNGKAMLRAETPGSWHVTEAAGFADIIVQADPGHTVYASSENAGKGSPGDHGWAPDFQEMHGIFIARGPRLPNGVRIPPINAVDVYPLLLEILELPKNTAIDGDQELLPSLLRPN
ncbi:MAG: ectonucleotide pyrophosphatase/phosphodiesterase [Gammaproteobacteria bacterium]|nr:ectonucleotide pyrophosphatase/phosphodiesterase [Gammaproteobacteria bacterium]